MERRPVIMRAKVERCEVSRCAYNLDNQCHAIAITVGGDAAHPRCDTFKVASCMFNKRLECNSPDIMVGYNRDEIDCLTFLPG
jgi:hypothetical protein